MIQPRAAQVRDRPFLCRFGRDVAVWLTGRTYDQLSPLPRTNPRTDMTEAYWMAAVRKHIDLVKQHAIPLDAIDIESWMKFPRRNLPETDPLAWTSIADYAHDVLIPGK